MPPNSDLLDALQKLRDAVQQLPASTPEGASDGIVPGSNPNPENNVLKGRFGMDLVLAFFDSAARSPELKSNEIFLIQLKLNQLIDLVHTRIQSLPRDISPRQTKKTQAAKSKQGRSGTSAHSKGKGKSVATTANDSENDADYRPPAVSEEDSEVSSGTTVTVGASAADTERTQGASKPKLRQKRPDPKRKGSSGLNRQRPTKKKRTWSTGHRIVSSASGSDADSETDTRAPKESLKRAKKKKWALSHFQAPVAGVNPDTQRKVWTFTCRYCPAVRRIARTKGCRNFTEETIRFQASNFTAHLRLCEKMPASEKWDVVSARVVDNAPPIGRANDSSSLGAIFATPEIASTQEQNPVALRKTRFRSALIQGVIHDNYPLTFGEGPGMVSVFRLINPEIKLPSHQTMRRDLDKLYNVLSKRVSTVIKSQKAQMSISSDAWSSKNSIYSLAGVVASFIDESWVLHHLPIDIIHLDAEHSGASMGRRVFNSIQRRGIGSNLIASVTDNASNNRTMNEEISRRYVGRYGVDLNVDNMTVTAILSKLGAMESLDDDEIYALAKAFDPEEPYENNQDTVDEQARLDKECNPTSKEEPPSESTDDSDEPSDFESELEGGDGDNQNTSSAGAHAAKTRKLLNAIEKIHAIVLHATGSPRRRKHMRGFIRQLCVKILALIKSMPVRWNSVLAEIRRAFILKKAINQWVLTLDEGLTGREQAAARARKSQWMLCDSEWDLIALLIELLEPFEQATLYFSKKSADSSLPAVLPTFARLLDSLNLALRRLEHKDPKDQFGMKPAIIGGRDKLIKYIKIAQNSQLTLLAMTVHPRLRLTTFNDPVWDRVAERGRALLEHMYEVYCADSAEDCPPAPPSQDAPSGSQSSSHGSWNDFLYQQTQEHRAGLTEEVHDYFSNKYPFDPKGNLLDWWKVHAKYLPVIGRISRDILCIPAASVSVERLFSQCRLVMTDNRIMAVETARRIITCQQWLKAGLGNNLPDFIEGQ